MWSNAFTHVLLFVIVGLLVSTMLMVNDLKRTHPAPLPADEAVVKQKMSSVEAEISKDRETAYTQRDPREALIAAERVAAQYQVLKLLDLPLNQEQQRTAEKLVADIRANFAPCRLDDERMFHALT